MTDLNQMPPHNREAEQGVLSALLREGVTCEAEVGDLAPEDFYFDAHQHVFAVFREQAAAGRAFDLPTCFEGLMRRGRANDVTAGYLAELRDAVPTAANIEYHAQVVAECSDYRRLIQAADELKRDAQDRVAPPVELAERFRLEADKTANGTRDTVTLDEAFGQVLDEANERNRPGGKRPVTTGFPDLDDALDEGWRGGDCVLIGARPSVGKSAFALALAVAAAESGVPVLFITLEMSAKEAAARVLAGLANVPLSQIRGKMLEPERTAQRLIDARQRTQLPIRFIDTPYQTPARISAAARKAVSKDKAGLIIVDYIQLIDHQGGKSDPHYVRVGNTSRRMKVLARSLNVPVICLAQINRDSEDRSEGRPQLSDFRESGNLEQDADTALLLWPEKFPSGPTPPTQVMRILVEKQRNGRRTQVELDYRRAVIRFESKRV